MKKIWLLLLGVVAVLAITFTSYLFLVERPSPAGSSFEQLEPGQGEEIGNSWNPPRNVECATIINAIAAVKIDNSSTNADEIEGKIIANTKLAAARLSVLAQKSLDKEIAAWSYKAALILVQFPTAISSNNQAAVTSLYDEIGKMVLNPPKTCDNTLNSAT
jgi:hypothetical protein